MQLQQKRVVAIHDISCMGRCSLTAALPLLSACGHETSILPTAVLSTHTGEFPGYTYRDLTDDLRAIAAHWSRLDRRTDAVYTGFLGSFAQLALVSELIESFRKESPGCLSVIDPVMADNGALYPTFTPDFIQGMAQLCAHADVITPNMTEAALMLGDPYEEGPYTPETIESMLTRLAQLGTACIVLTGVWFHPGEVGAACLERSTGQISYFMTPRAPGMFYGTGDVFASILTGAMLCGNSLRRATALAVEVTYRSIRRAVQSGLDRRYGVPFEQEIPFLVEQLLRRHDG